MNYIFIQFILPTLYLKSHGFGGEDRTSAKAIWNKKCSVPVLVYFTSSSEYT